jgi:hypothetical protein
MIQKKNRTSKTIIIKKSALKKAIVALSAGFILLIILGGLFVINLSATGKELDSQSKEYVDSAIPAIVLNWSEQELEKRADIELLKATPNNSIHNLFAYSSENLGSFKKYDGSKGEASIISTNLETTITANYIANAEFEKSPATIQISLIKRGEEWKILSFHVNINGNPPSSSSFTN